MDLGRNRPSNVRFRQLSFLGISIIGLALAAWVWMSNPATPRPGSDGEPARTALAPAASAPLEGALAVGFAAAALAALALAAWALHGLLQASRRELQLKSQLQSARADLQALSRSVDAWQWATDERHRLIDLKPPRQADGTAWNAASVAQGSDGRKPFLWDCVHVGESGDGRGLRARLEARHDIDAEDARFIGHWRPPETTATEPWILRASPRFDEEGRFAGYIGTARRTLASAQNEEDGLEALPQDPPDTLQAMGSDSQSFSYTVSHDLRAPLRVVEGFTKIIKEDYGRQLDRVGNDHLDRVLGAAARMNSMIDALLALAQLQSAPLVKQPINLSQLAQYIIDDLRRQSPEREVVVHIDPHLQVRGDPTLLRVTLENLLGNAWKYTSKRRLAQIWFEREPHDTQLCFCVRDNGAGFDMRFADRLFGVFQRLHSANDFQGTGVGLASVRRIVRRHGGEIWADSDPDRGASFHFTLPG